MSNLKIKLPEQCISTLYQFQSWDQKGQDTTTQSQGDPTNYCTTILTTTHFV
jgi:hypothetical protein